MHNIGSKLPGETQVLLVGGIGKVISYNSYLGNRLKTGVK